MTTRSLAILFLPVLALMGCSVEVTGGTGGGTGGGGGRPGTGSDVRIDALWTINGGVATEGACATANLSAVELHIYSDATGTDEVIFYDGFCEDGGFITGFDLRAAQYYYEWVGYDADDVETFRNESLVPLDARAGGTFFVDADFAYDSTPVQGNQMGVYATFDVEGSSAELGARCDAAGISWVEIVIIDGDLEYTFDELWNDCDQGTIDSQNLILPLRDFTYEFRAYDADNNLVDSTGPYDLVSADVDVDGFFNAGDELFEVNGVRLRVNLTYQNGGNFVSCYGAGATTTKFTWTLYDRDPALGGAVPIYEREVVDVCWDFVTIDDYPYGLLETKTPYFFDIESTNSSGKAWAGTCEIELNHLGYNVFDCAVPSL